MQQQNQQQQQQHQLRVITETRNDVKLISVKIGDLSFSFDPTVTSVDEWISMFMTMFALHPPIVDNQIKLYDGGSQDSTVLRHNNGGLLLEVEQHTALGGSVLLTVNMPQTIAISLLSQVINEIAKLTPA
jgi:hypothetical protein